MTRWRWLAPVTIVGGAILARRFAPRFRQAVANIHAFDLPSAAVYDALVTPLFDRLYARIALELAQQFRSGHILEVGGGSGRVAVRLAQRVPDLQITGVDLAPDMVERANQHAAVAGLMPRVHSLVGDVASLSFPDAHFDGVYSTFSVHHWSEPAKGMAELYRVLKPGAEAWIYDIPPWLRRSFHAGPELGTLVAASPFGGGVVEIFRVRGIPAYTRLVARRDGA
ncbi:MAG: class I SAM-dependent methyltransferase [Chloroflexi bacterium]|nr:class I SAM-dependent methyltransferase [Chloroflexota bacterium]